VWRKAQPGASQDKQLGDGRSILVTAIGTQKAIIEELLQSTSLALTHLWVWLWTAETKRLLYVHAGPTEVVSVEDFVTGHAYKGTFQADHYAGDHIKLHIQVFAMFWVDEHGERRRTNIVYTTCAAPDTIKDHGFAARCCLRNLRHLQRRRAALRLPPITVDWRISDGGPRDYKNIYCFAHRSATADLCGLTVNAMFTASGKGKGVADASGHEVKSWQREDDASRTPSNSHMESVTFLRAKAQRVAMAAHIETPRAGQVYAYPRAHSHALTHTNTQKHASTIRHKHTQTNKLT